MNVRKTTLADKISVLELLEKHKFIHGDCWRSLIEKTNESGHPQLKIEGKLYFISRLSMYVFKDFDLNSDLLILHKVECKNPDCWNPDHLYVGTHYDNAQDRLAVKYANLSPNFKCGHPRSPENTTYEKNRNYIMQRCVICNRQRTIKSRARKRGVVLQ